MSGIGMVTAQQFHTEQRIVLQAFLTQESAESGKKNWQQLLPATYISEPDWDNTTDWLNDLEGVSWSGTVIMEITDINWVDKKLSGNLDLRGLSSLANLYCGNNSLLNLDVSGLTSLIELSCGNSALTSLNVSGLTSLVYLNCGYNSLTNLDVKGLSSLNVFNCDNCSLTNLNLSDLPSLTYLACSDNLLTTLDVSGLPSLNYLACSNNSLVSINVSGLSSLTNLACFNNSLTSLDVSGLSLLNFLNCHTNLLTSLNVSGLSSLPYLYCQNNWLPLSQLPDISFVPVKYSYTPQKEFSGGSTEGSVDLREHLRDANTVFKWYTTTDQTTQLNDITGSNGLFIIPSSYDGDSLICHITHPGFPDLTTTPLVYKVKKIASTVEPPYIPTYVKVSIPYVNGIITDYAPGIHTWKSDTSITLSVTAEPGYSLTEVSVKGNGQVLPLLLTESDENTHIYDLGNLLSDMVITIEGVKFTGVSSEIIQESAASLSSLPGNLLIKAVETVDLLIYTPIGTLYSHQQVTAGTTTIPLPQGIYFIRLDDKSYKVMIKN